MRVRVYILYIKEFDTGVESLCQKCGGAIYRLRTFFAGLGLIFDIVSY
jgi:hypothetical protein